MTRPPVDLKRCTLQRLRRRHEADGTLTIVHRYREFPRLTRITRRGPMRAMASVTWAVDGEPARDLAHALDRLVGRPTQMELPW